MINTKAAKRSAAQLLNACAIMVAGFVYVSGDADAATAQLILVGVISVNTGLALYETTQD